MIRLQLCEPENITLPVVRIVIALLNIFFLANWVNELIFVYGLDIDHLIEYAGEEMFIEHLINCEIGGLATDQGPHVILKLARNMVNVRHVISLKTRHRAAACGLIGVGQLCPDILLITCKIIVMVWLGDHLSR